MRKMSFTNMAVAFLSLGFLAWAGTAGAYTVNDNTLVGRGTTNGTETVFDWVDHVDGSNDATSGRYNAFGIDIVFSGGNMKISLYSNFWGPETGYDVDVALADLALDLNRDGNYEYGVALTAREPGIAAGRLYTDLTWKTSVQYFEGQTTNNYQYGEAWGTSDNYVAPIVHIKSGTAVGDVQWTADPTDLTPSFDPSNDPSYRYDLTIPLSLFGSNLKDQIGIFWAGYTCGNDIIVGTTSVPVPASILLLASGLAGMLGIATRRRAAA